MEPTEKQEEIKWTFIEVWMKEKVDITFSIGWIEELMVVANAFMMKVQDIVWDARKIVINDWRLVLVEEVAEQVEEEVE